MSDLHITTQLIAALPGDASAQAGAQAGAPAGLPAAFDFPALLARQLEAAPDARDASAPETDSNDDEARDDELDAFGMPLASVTLPELPRQPGPAAEAPLEAQAAAGEGVPPLPLPPRAGLKILAPAPAANDGESAPVAPAAGAPSAWTVLGIGVPAQAAKDVDDQTPAKDAAQAGAGLQALADTTRPDAPAHAFAEPARADSAPQAHTDTLKAESIAQAGAELQARAAAEAAPAPAYADAAQVHGRIAAPENRAPVLTVPGQLHTPLWRDELGAAVRVLAVQNIQHAELRVHPPELGPVQVSLRLEAGEATVSFTAPHAETRAALEAALPRLRDMLEDAGLAFGGASVDVSNPGQERGHEPGPRAQAFAYLPQAPRALAERTVLGLVDVFA
jgi:flagellar hook-length control protein FliK